MGMTDPVGAETGARGGRVIETVAGVEMVAAMSDALLRTTGCGKPDLAASAFTAPMMRCA